MNLHYFFKAFGVLAFAGALSLLFTFLTGCSACFIYSVGGIPCPSCGMTRAVMALFTGNILLAFRLHPLFWLVPVIPFLFINPEKSALLKRNIIYVIIFLFILVWILRMIFLFPDNYPMELNRRSLAVFLAERLFGYSVPVFSETR